jgi:amidase
MPVLNRNPLSRRKGELVPSSIVFLHELKHDLNRYLHDWAVGTPIRTLADLIAFNQAHAGQALRFGQDLLLAAEATRGDLTEPEYHSARAMDLRSAKERGLDAYLARHAVEAVVFPGWAGAAIAARAGYPSVQVPAGFIAGVEGRDTPEFPLGLTFTGPAWSEATLLRLAYAYEQASRERRPPPGLPPLPAP